VVAVAAVLGEAEERFRQDDTCVTRKEEEKEEG